MSFSLLKCRDCNFSSDGWKVVKELFQGVLALDVIDERLDRDARADEYGVPPKISGSE